MQKSIGKNVPALRIRSELNLINCQKLNGYVLRHCLDGADPILRCIWLNLFLASNEGNLVHSYSQANLVVNLSGEQAQRQTYHASFVVKHTLDCQVCFSGIGRTQHRRNIADTSRMDCAHGLTLFFTLPELGGLQLA